MRERFDTLADNLVSNGAVVIVQAPAGFGKTTFLHALARGRDDVRWFDCRSPDAVARWRSGFPADRGSGAWVIDEPERLAGPLRVDVIGHALDRASITAPLWLATRRLADVPVARCLAYDHTTVVRAEQLLLSHREVEQLCERRVSRAQARAIHAIAQGWPALTLLLRRWVEGGGSLDAPDWYMRSGAAAYIEQEVLATLPLKVRAALPVAGVIEDIPLAMAEAIACELDAARSLVVLAQSVPELAVLTNDACRLHPILQVAARGAFAAARGPRRTAWQLRGADWLAANGDLLSAARMAAAAGAPQRIVDYMRDAGGLALWIEGRIELVEELTTLAGADRIDADPQLLLLRCVRKLKDGRVLEAERLFASACASLPDDPAIRQQAVFVRSALAVYGCRPATTDLSNEMIEDVPSAIGVWGSLGATIQLIASIQAADFDRARAYLRLAREQSRTIGPTYNLAFLSVHEAEMELASGTLAAARKAIDQARRRWRGSFAHDRGLETVIAATTAQLEFEAGRCGAARRQLRLAQGRMPDAEAWLDIYVATYEPYFRMIAADDGLAPALEAIGLTCVTLTTRGLPRVADLLEALGTCLAGERALADPTLVVMRSRIGTDRDIADWPTWQEREMFWLAEGYRRLAAGTPERALGPLLALREHARETGLRRCELRAELVLVAAYARAGRNEEADESFSSALAIAEDTGMRRALVEFGGADVAARLASQRPDYVRLRPEERRDEPATTARPEVRFTPRENDILQAIRLGGSDKVVARRVGISEHGVRFHLKNMFRKLSVRDRVSLIVAADLPPSSIG